MPGANDSTVKGLRAVGSDWIISLEMFTPTVVLRVSTTPALAVTITSSWMVVVSMGMVRVTFLPTNRRMPLRMTVLKPSSSNFSS